MKGVRGLIEAVAPDEPHRIVGPAVGVRPQTVDGHDPRVLEPTGHLGLDEKPLAAHGVVRMMVEDLLQRHLAMQLLIDGDVNGAQSAAGMGPHDAEPRTVTRGGVELEGRRTVGGLGRHCTRMRERRLELRPVDDGEAREGGGVDLERRQALLGVAPMSRNVPVDQGQQQVTAGRVEGLLLDQQVSQ
ncbi:MAG: hypothetical protein U0835_15435 [Isosphaeraceae bacterium]